MGRSAVSEFGLELDGPAFLKQFRAWPRGLYPGAIDLVREVSAASTTGLLSNTNELHWSGGIDRWILRDMVDNSYLSFEIGLVKPDQELFQFVIDDLGVAASSILFIDDNLLNVEAARLAGLRSERCAGPSKARSAVVSAGVLGR